MKDVLIKIRYVILNLSTLYGFYPKVHADLLPSSIHAPLRVLFEITNNIMYGPVLKVSKTSAWKRIPRTKSAIE